MSSKVPAAVTAALYKPSEYIFDTAISVHGPDFEKDLSLQDLLASNERIGFQATNFGRAINIVNRMVGLRLRACGYVELTVCVTRFSEHGASQTNLSRQMERGNQDYKQEHRHAVTSSSATRQTSSRPVCARSYVTLSSTNTSPYP